MEAQLYFEGAVVGEGATGENKGISLFLSSRPPFGWALLSQVC